MSGTQIPRHNKNNMKLSDQASSSHSKEKLPSLNLTTETLSPKVLTMKLSTTISSRKIKKIFTVLKRSITKEP